MNPNIRSPRSRHARAPAPTAHMRRERAGDAVPAPWEPHLCCQEANQHQRTKPLTQSCTFSAPVGCEGRGPGPVCAVQARRRDPRSRNNTCSPHASAEPLPGRSGSHCNAIKHTLMLLLSHSHGPLLLPGKDRASSHAVLHAAKKSKKVLNVLYQLRCKTFLLHPKRGDKHLESS